MIHAQCNKFVSVTPPAAIVDNASLTCNVIDTLGFDYVEVFCYIGATDIATVALKVQESDVAASATALTGGADVTGLVYGTSTDIAAATSALPSATDDNKCFKFEVDMRGRKRYLLPVVTGGDGAAGTFYSVFALLSKADAVPVTKAERGYGNILRV